jgi:N-acetylglucosaminyl-diphospho-decaprenol L-rhamnosyltransferase
VTAVGDPGPAAPGRPGGLALLVVVSYGSAALVEANLGAMTLPGGVEVVVVDCFSTPRERTAVARLAARHGWRAVLLEDNRGFGGGVNAGAALAAELGADVIATLNPDATIDAEALTLLVTHARTHPGAIASPRIVGSAGKVWFAGADLYLDDGSTAGARRRDALADRPRRPWATGACFALSADLWDRLGGFDERYFLYWEDIDLSHRALDLGATLDLLEAANAVHDEGQTHGRQAGDRAKTPLYYRYNIRNRLLYAALHLDDVGQRRWLRSAPRVAYGVLLQGGRRQLLGLAPWRAYVTGLWEGWRLLRRPRAGRS